MLALKDSKPGERMWMVTDRLSPVGNRRLMDWVRDRSQGSRFDRGPIDAFLDSDPGEWLALFSMYAFADVPLGFEVAYALSHVGNGSPQACPMTLKHIIWQGGVALSATEHGHKHFLCWSTRTAMPPLLEALPVRDDLRFEVHSPCVHLVSASDWPEVQRRLSAV